MSNEADKSASSLQKLDVRNSDEMPALWNCTVELHCGTALRNCTAELHCGTALRNCTVELHCGTVLWNGTVERHVVRLHDVGKDRLGHDVCAGESFFMDCEGWRGR